MKNAIIRILFMTFIISTLALAASAQRKYGVIKSLVFKPGTSSTRIVSTLKSVREVHEYHFRVRAGPECRVSTCDDHAGGGDL